jgi:hypothetical protein
MAIIRAFHEALDHGLDCRQSIRIFANTSSLTTSQLVTDQFDSLVRSRTKATFVFNQVQLPSPA